jgi:hypothetical protein
VSAVVGVVGGDDGLAVGQLAQLAAVLPLHAHGMLPLLGDGRIVQAERAVLGVRTGPPKHQGQALLVQRVGVPRAIDQEVLELLQGSRQDLGDPLAVLSGQVRDQAEEVVGAVLDPALAGEDGAEELDERLESRAIDVSDDQLHRKSPWQIIMPRMSPE